MRLRERASAFWREYTRMRTAILFLIGIALIVLVGSFVPQQDTSQQAKVDEFLGAHRHLDTLATHLGLPLTQVFVSPLFYVLLGSLYIALASCVLRRGTALVRRTLRRHPWGTLRAAAWVLTRHSLPSTRNYLHALVLVGPWRDVAESQLHACGYFRRRDEH